MKKIFAIALALVMVLSMASAFAMTCTTGYDWSCTTTYNCGKATVEVVPYVVANACNGKSSEYVESSCAAAVYGQEVFYAVKINVPADINEEWFDAAELTIKLTGLSGFGGMANNTNVLSTIKKNADKDFGEKALTYYVKNSSAVVSADADDFAIDENIVWSAKVTDAKTAKVCATLTSEYMISHGENSANGTKVKDWYVQYNADDSNLIFNTMNSNGSYKYADAIVHFNSDNKVTWVASDYEGSATDQKFVGWDGDQLIKKDEEATRVSTSCGAAAKIAAVLKYFNLDFGTCVTEDAIKANFGWDDEVKSCFSWSSNATAVVDADCVVAIPKTGDVSVVAYAVMAVVAAAGTMLKK